MREIIAGLDREIQYLSKLREKAIQALSADPIYKDDRSRRGTPENETTPPSPAPRNWRQRSVDMIWIVMVGGLATMHLNRLAALADDVLSVVFP